MIERRRANRRTSLVMIVLFAIVVSFAIRLVDLQVVRADTINDEAEGKRSVPVTTYGTRGSIVDANGTVLAYSVTTYDINVSPRVLLRRGVDAVVLENLELIGEAIGRSRDELLAIVTEDPESDWAQLAKGVDVETFRAVRELSIAGITYDRRPARIYPNGAIAGSLVGVLGTDEPQAGLERAYDDCLASINGTSTYERSGDGVQLPGSEVQLEAPVDGGDLKLTIDSDLQWFAQQTIAEQGVETGAEWATAVVVRIADGHIMAAADWPSMDPNDIDSGPRDANGNLILGSRLFTSPYEPGSTFKSMTVAMLIDAGVASKSTEIIAPRYFVTPSGQRIGDAWDHGDERFTLAGVLVYSSNTGLSSVVERLDRQTRYDYMRAFGLGESTEVGFPGESGGILHPGTEWDGVSRYNVMFGQGVAATSAQVASIYQTLGNGGVRMPLTLVEGCELPDGTVIEQPTGEGERVVSEKAADEVIAILENNVTQNGIQAGVPGYRVAVKTGTAEVPEPDGSGYGSERILSVAGVAPVEDPQYAVVVTLGLPDTIKGSRPVAPTFAKIMSQTLTTFRVTPSGETVPTIPLTW